MPEDDPESAAPTDDILSEIPPKVPPVGPRTDPLPGLPVARVLLKPKRARPFFGRHPWVLDSAVLRVEGEPAPGDVVDLTTHDGSFVARGLWNPDSRIRVRLYAFSASEQLDDAFWRRRVERAVALRRLLGLHDRAVAARLINSEGDDLSGLIVDRFSEWLCVQFTARAMHCRMELICDLLEEMVRPAGILLRSAERGLGKLEGMQTTDGLVRGRLPDGPVFIKEHGLRFGVDLAEGQKTGFYLDQRDNRQAAARLARGRRVLDMFCYSGGFSVACAQAGAASVLAVDGSAKATALAEANAGLNGASAITVETADAFKKLDALAAAGERFGMVILDPPKFARNRSSHGEALKAYHRINRQGVDLLEPGGILVTCSCSGSVARDDFLMMLSGVAQRSGRSLSMLECRGAAPDHPVSVSCLEGEYLTCVIARVN
jgi:23S rRNA (cytosine1962-C5)-methyltransferase